MQEAGEHAIENGALVFEQADLLEDPAEGPIRRVEKPHVWSRSRLNSGFAYFYTMDGRASASVRKCSIPGIVRASVFANRVKALRTRR